MSTLFEPTPEMKMIPDIERMRFASMLSTGQAWMLSTQSLAIIQECTTPQMWAAVLTDSEIAELLRGNEVVK